MLVYICLIYCYIFYMNVQLLHIKKACVYNLFFLYRYITVVSKEWKGDNIFCEIFALHFDNLSSHKAHTLLKFGINFHMSMTYQMMCFLINCLSTSSLFYHLKYSVVNLPPICLICVLYSHIRTFLYILFGKLYSVKHIQICHLSTSTLPDTCPFLTLLHIYKLFGALLLPTTTHSFQICYTQFDIFRLNCVIISVLCFHIVW